MAGGAGGTGILALGTGDVLPGGADSDGQGSGLIFAGNGAPSPWGVWHRTVAREQAFKS